MSKIWFCRNCGYEVEARGRCHQCKRRLEESPLAELPAGDEDDEVGYRLGDWVDRARGGLIVALIEGNVPHRFEGDELIVSAAHEERVDGLVEDVAAEVAEQEAEAASPTDPLSVDIRMLAEAADRLRTEPTDMEADNVVLETSSVVFMAESWPRVDADTWAAVGRVTRRLLAALSADEALEEEISLQAGILGRLLEPGLHPEPAVSEEEEDETESSETDDEADPESVSVESPRAEDAGGRAVDEEADGSGAKGGATDDGETPRRSRRWFRRGRGATAEADDIDADEELEEGLPLEVESDEDEPADDDGAEQFIEGGPPVANEEDTTPEEFAEEEDLAEDEIAETEEEDASPDDAEESADGDAADENAAPGDAADEPRAGESVYELPEWLPEQRIHLSLLLEEADIAYGWEEAGDLVIPLAREGEVEVLFGRVSGVSSEVDEEARYRALEELFSATSRFLSDPDNIGKATEVLRRANAADGPTPVGIADADWWNIRRDARAVADSIESNASLDVVFGEARQLRDRLRPLM